MDQLIREIIMEDDEIKSAIKKVVIKNLKSLEMSKTQKKNLLGAIVSEIQTSIDSLLDESWEHLQKEMTKLVTDNLRFSLKH